ncbi:unnamed protein product, partial [Didymodactylos carnosus]
MGEQDRSKLYEKFVKLYTQYYSATVSHNQTLYHNANKEWNTLKTDHAALCDKLTDYSSKIMMRKGDLQRYWGMKMKTKSGTTISQLTPSPTLSLLGTKAVVCNNEVEETANKRETPAQTKTSKELHDVNEKLTKLQALKSTGLFTDENRRMMKDSEEQRRLLKLKLKSLTTDQERKRKKRANFKQALNVIVEKHPDVADTLKRFKRNDPHRPSLEVDQPGLLETILEIASPAAAADDRRRTELLRSIKTLDDLTEELSKRGFHLSRTGTYLRLIPRRWNTTEGKRHVTTVPVKLIRAQNTMRHCHPDSRLAAASIEYLKDLASLFGSQCTLVLSQDDKARVPLGLPAAKKQAPILMHLEYRVQLPDHDFVIAEKHKLIPSVYAVLTFKNKLLSYSGPTYIGIRSGKHDRSTAFTHLQDLSK